MKIIENPDSLTLVDVPTGRYLFGVIWGAISLALIIYFWLNDEVGFGSGVGDWRVLIKMITAPLIFTSPFLLISFLSLTLPSKQSYRFCKQLSEYSIESRNAFRSKKTVLIKIKDIKAVAVIRGRIGVRRPAPHHTVVFLLLNCPDDSYDDSMSIELGIDVYPDTSLGIAQRIASFLQLPPARLIQTPKGE